MSVVVALLAVIVGLLYLAARHRFSYWERRGIPHDTPSLPRGNFGDWPSRRQFSTIFKDYYLKYRNQNVPFAGFFFFFTKSVVLTDVELIKKVLIKDFNNFEDRGVFYNEVDDPLSAHLFSLEGEKWRNLRHKLTPTFTSGKMKHMFPTVMAIGQELSNTFKKKAVGPNGSVHEITDLVARYTADVIGSCAFGLDCNSLNNPEAEFVQMGKRAILDRRYWGLLDFFIFGFPKLARKLGLKLTIQEVHDFYFRIVRDSVNYRLNNKVDRQDFMNIMVEMYQKHLEGNSKEGISMDEMAAQSFIFFLAGFETSSTTMGFALYELAQHQEIQDQLRKEINEVLAKNNNIFNYEGMKQMHYMEKVVMETLRKYPVLGHLIRKAKGDYFPGDPKYYIEKGTLAVISAYGIHYNPDYYPEPQKFDPERFTEEAIASRPSCTWLPFGEGPRNCIGSRFGLMQAQIGLAYLIKDFKFTVAPETQIPLKLINKNVLLSSADGIYLKIEGVTN